MKLPATLLLTLHLAAANTAALAQERSAAEGWPGSRWWLPTALFAQVGRASETSTFTAGAQWDWTRHWTLGRRGRISGYNELALGQWRADQGGGSAIVTQFGLTPTFRYWSGGQTTGWFYEGAIGVNVLTPVYRTRQKRFSTALNFGDHVAVGYREPGARGWEWSLRLQHFSNAGIQHPNPGENFVQLRLVVPLRSEGL